MVVLKSSRLRGLYKLVLANTHIRISSTLVKVCQVLEKEISSIQFVKLTYP